MNGIPAGKIPLEVPGGALVAAADPITLTTGDLGHLAVIVNANDVAVSGARPRWFLAVVLLPLGTTEVVRVLASASPPEQPR